MAKNREIGLVQYQGQLVAIFETFELALQYLCLNQGCVLISKFNSDVEFPPSKKVLFPDGFELIAPDEAAVLTVTPVPAWGPSCLLPKNP